MGLLTRLRMEFEGLFGITAENGDYAGNVRLRFPQLDERWVAGTTEGKANLGWSDYEAEIADGATRNLDLRALTGPLGSTLTMVEVRAIGIFVRNEDSPATPELTIAKGASNGFTGLGAAFSVKIKGGTWFWLVCPKDGKISTGASDKVLDISNASGATVTYSLVVIGTSA